MNIIKALLRKLCPGLFTHMIKVKWRKNNSHNFTAVDGETYGQVTAGNYTYGVIHAPYIYGKITIGSFCSIADEVSFLSAGEHCKNHLSTYPFRAKIAGCPEISGVSKGDIVVEDDVWIGYRATILSGVTIGQGAIIGAGTIVAKDIPPYAVYAGGKIVKYRFPDYIIQQLLKFDFSSLTEADIKENMDLLYQELDDSFFESAFYKEHLKK